MAGLSGSAGMMLLALWICLYAQGLIMQLIGYLVHVCAVAVAEPSFCSAALDVQSSISTALPHFAVFLCSAALFTAWHKC
jgi:hypothetical protein